MDLDKLDMTLLRVFHRVMMERKVSTAAEALGLTQPAVSNALKRLRDITKDDLFIRTSGGMQPTTFAIQIAEPVGYALAAIDSTFSQPVHFDPITDNRTFNLGLTDIGETYLLPRLLAHTMESAPNIRFNTVRQGSDSLQAEMENGNIDLAVDILPQLKGDILHRRLLNEEYVICLRKQHPMARKRLWTPEDYLRQSHMVVVAKETGHGDVDTILAKKGMVRDIKLTVPHFMTLGPTLATTDMISTLPVDAARMLENPFNLTTVPLPISIPTVDVDVCWHRRVHRDPANLWLRGLMFDLFHRL
ncbi:MAG: LysR family transcriptional regulator [Alteromonas oceani]